MIRRLSAFTLIELSIVIAVLSLLAAASLRYAAALQDANNTNTLNATLDTIDAALITYAVNNGRLPCPADITQPDNSATFGTETGIVGDGYCGTTGGLGGVAVNFVNSSTDPDATGGTDPGAPDTNYDSATLNEVVAGAVPNKALRLADKLAYDPWGRKIFYAVDKRMTGAYTFDSRITGTNAMTTYPAYSSGTTTIGAIVIKNTATDLLANAITYKAVYALVSAGKNGHGGYVRSPSTTSVTFNAGSSNSDEQKNCHCDSTATATNFDRIFVQKAKTIDPASLTDSFDDVVRFRTRGELNSAPAQLQ